MVYHEEPSVSDDVLLNPFKLETGLAAVYAGIPLQRHPAQDGA